MRLKKKKEEKRTRNTRGLGLDFDAGVAGWGQVVGLSAEVIFMWSQREIKPSFVPSPRPAPLQTEALKLRSWTPARRQPSKAQLEQTRPVRLRVLLVLTTEGSGEPAPENSARLLISVPNRGASLCVFTLLRNQVYPVIPTNGNLIWWQTHVDNAQAVQSTLNETPLEWINTGVL